MVKDIPVVKYFYYNDKMELGEKRNLMHSKCSGDIIVYMDDDDYYPPERISHAVQMLQDNPTFLIAGSSEMHIYFDSKKEIYQCGPYGKYHATAATFAFKKELLTQTKYDDKISFGEESKFTKKYTIPLLQLDTLKTIFVCSHKHNSLNKERLLENYETNKFVNKSTHSISDFIKDPILKQFYILDMDKLLSNYTQGNPENKPKLMNQVKLKERELECKKQQIFNTQQKSSNIDIQQKYEKKIAEQTILINELLNKVKYLSNELSKYKS